MHRRLGGLLAGAASCAAACLIASSAVRTQTPEAPTLRVVTTSPEGEAEAMVTQASIRFSEAMVPLGGAAAVDRVAFVTIEPAVDVSYRWSTSQILVVTPRAGRFPHASTVAVTIGAEATALSGRRLGAAHRFSFTTRRRGCSEPTVNRRPIRRARGSCTCASTSRCGPPACSST